MFATTKNRLLASGIVASAALFFALPSQAATVTYNLTRVGSLTNVDDSAGRWQFDGGNVYLNGSHVGYYIRKKRVSFGVPSSVNKAAVETTIMWKWGNYSFINGSQVGGVTATSAGWTSLQDATYSGTHTAVTIDF